MRETLRFLVALVGTNLKASLALRGTFLLRAFFMMVNNLVFFVMWWVFFLEVEEIRGWRVADMAAITAVSAGAFGLAVVFGGGVRNLARIIAEGDLDWDPDDMPSGVDRGPTGEGGWGTGRTAGQAPGTDDLSSGADGDAAVEAWLRRIPDDPGGLLRRKFALQYERRGGRPPDGEESAW